MGGRIAGEGKGKEGKGKKEVKAGNKSERKKDRRQDGCFWVSHRHGPRLLCPFDFERGCRRPAGCIPRLRPRCPALRPNAAAPTGDD